MQFIAKSATVPPVMGYEAVRWSGFWGWRGAELIGCECGEEVDKGVDGLAVFGRLRA